MATSSFFKPLIITSDDEEAIIRAFDTTKKIKLKTDNAFKLLNKDEALALLEKIKEQK